MHNLEKVFRKEHSLNMVHMVTSHSSVVTVRLERFLEEGFVSTFYVWLQWEGAEESSV